MTTLSKEDVDLAAEKFDYSGFSDEFRTSADGLHAFADHIATLARADLVAENGLTKLALSQKIELLKSCEQALGKSYAENERLKEMVSIANKGKKENLTECLQLTDQLTATRTALAAAEAREGKLRAAIDVVLSDAEECEDHDGWLANLVSCEAIHQLDEAFSQPRDYSALREMIAGVYEECAKVCLERAANHASEIRESEADDCAFYIRARAEKVRQGN